MDWAQSCGPDNFNGRNFVKRDKKMNESKARGPTEQSASALGVIGLHAADLSHLQRAMEGDSRRKDQRCQQDTNFANSRRRYFFHCCFPEERRVAGRQYEADGHDPSRRRGICRTIQFLSRRVRDRLKRGSVTAFVRSQQLPVSEPFIRLEIKRGNLQATRLGRRVIILAESMNKWLELGTWLRG